MTVGPSTAFRIVAASSLVVSMMLAGHGEAQNFAAGVDAHDRGNYLQAFEIWVGLAVRGDAAAQYNVGLMLEKGTGVATDAEQAVQWYYRAAEQGYVPAQYNLGGMLYRGAGIAVDFAAAATMWQRAAKAGHTNAQYNLGTLFQRGEGVPKSLQNAIHWWRLAASGGHIEAQYHLGRVYVTGEGAPRDVQLARRWLRPAAAAGFAPAREMLAAIGTNHTEQSAPRPPVAGQQQATIQPTVIRETAWILAQNPRHYTVQLGTLRSRGAAREFVVRHRIEQVAAIAPVGKRYVVVGGVFADLDQARAAIPRLTRALRDHGAFARSFAAVQREISPSTLRQETGDIQSRHQRAR